MEFTDDEILRLSGCVSARLSQLDVSFCRCFNQDNTAALEHLLPLVEAYLPLYEKLTGVEFMFQSNILREKMYGKRLNLSVL